MSHTTQVDVEIKDIKAFQDAINILQKEYGVKCELVQNATPRMYYQDQFKKQYNKNTAEYVLKLADSRYDVGLVEQLDSNGKRTSCYSLVYDGWAGDIKRQIGTKCSIDQANTQEVDKSHVGLLNQLYASCATKRVAQRQGYRIKNQKLDKATGKIHLILGA